METPKGDFLVSAALLSAQAINSVREEARWEMKNPHVITLRGALWKVAKLNGAILTSALTAAILIMGIAAEISSLEALKNHSATKLTENLVLTACIILLCTLLVAYDYRLVTTALRTRRTRAGSSDRDD